MPMSSTSDRYQYIYGSAARKFEQHEPVNRKYKSYQARTKQEVASYQAQGMATPASREELSIKNNQRRFYAVDRRFALILLLSVVMVAIACVIYVNKSSQISSMSRQVKQLKTEKANLLNKQAAIKSEIDKALDLEEIRSYAETNLKMVNPTGSKVIYYQNNSSDYFRQYGNVESGE